MDSTTDWATIQKEYVTTDKTIRELSDEFGVSRKTIGQHCKEENWVEQRAKHAANKTRMVSKAVLKADIKQEAKQATTTMQKAELACDKFIETMLSQADKVKGYTPQMQQAWAKALDIGVKLSRELHGYISPVELEKIDAMKRELTIKEEEHKKFMEQDAINKEPITIRIENDDLEKYAK